MTTHAYERPLDERVNWPRNIPYLAIHLIPIAMIWTGFTRRDVLLCIALYCIRIFFITALSIVFLPNPSSLLQTKSKYYNRHEITIRPCRRLERRLICLMN